MESVFLKCCFILKTLNIWNDYKHMRYLRSKIFTYQINLLLAIVSFLGIPSLFGPPTFLQLPISADKKESKEKHVFKVLTWMTSYSFIYFSTVVMAAARVPHVIFNLPNITIRFVIQNITSDNENSCGAGNSVSDLLNIS